MASIFNKEGFGSSQKTRMFKASEWDDQQVLPKDAVIEHIRVDGEEHVKVTYTGEYPTERQLHGVVIGSVSPVLSPAAVPGRVMNQVVIGSIGKGKTSFGVIPEIDPTTMDFVE